MSKKTVITCDHCGKEIPNNCDERFSHMGCNAAFAMGTIDACSREHLGLALAKAFGLDNLAGRLVSVFEAAYHTGPNDQLASVRAGIRAVLAALPMPIMQPVSVDGKTPGQVALEAWNPDANGHSIYRDDWERAALAVLRAFGQPSQAKTNAAEALRRVRERIDGLEKFSVMDGDCPISVISIADVRLEIDELAKLEAKPTTNAEAITLPTKPTKPLRERLEELAASWFRGDKELNGAYRLARQECAKELREVINDLR